MSDPKPGLLARMRAWLAPARPDDDIDDNAEVFEPHLARPDPLPPVLPDTLTPPVAGQADVDPEQAALNTALWTAIRAHQPVGALLASGADVEAFIGDNSVLNALTLSIVEQNRAAFDAVLARCDVNRSLGGRYTALSFALSKPVRHSFVQALLDEGADVRDGAGEMGSALEVAWAHGIRDKDLLTALVGHGALRGELGGRVVMAGLKVNMAPWILDLLLVHGARVNQDVLLMDAAKAGDIVMAELWLRHGASVLTGNERGQTALMIAASYGHGELCQRLLDSGADPNALDRDGDSPLIGAATHGEADCVQRLLEAGATDSPWVQSGKTASGMARRLGFADIAQQIVAFESKTGLEAVLPEGIETSVSRKRL